MSTIQEKIAEIEAEMARTQKNKATSYHLGTLKAKIAKLRRELFAPSSGGKFMALTQWLVPGYIVVIWRSYTYSLFPRLIHIQAKLVKVSVR
jgi:hypothetical protein